MRTVSGTSLGDGAGFSADIPFTNSGYETITLNKANYMNTTRCIASRINETSSPVIQDFSGDRSFNLRLNLESNDPRVSPIIDTQRANVILTSNRGDAPILDYKNISLLRKYVSDNGKIISSRITSVSFGKQKKLAKEIKKAKILGLL